MSNLQEIALKLAHFDVTEGMTKKDYSSELLHLRAGEFYHRLDKGSFTSEGLATSLLEKHREKMQLFLTTQSKNALIEYCDVILIALRRIAKEFQTLFTLKLPFLRLVCFRFNLLSILLVTYSFLFSLKIFKFFVTSFRWDFGKSLVKEITLDNLISPE